MILFEGDDAIVCDECDAEFKVEAIAASDIVAFCPFCGAPIDNKIDSDDDEENQEDLFPDDYDKSE